MGLCECCGGGGSRCDSVHLPLPPPPPPLPRHTVQWGGHRGWQRACTDWSSCPKSWLWGLQRYGGACGCVLDCDPEERHISEEGPVTRVRALCGGQGVQRPQCVCVGGGARPSTGTSTVLTGGCPPPSPPQPTAQSLPVGEQGGEGGDLLRGPPMSPRRPHSPPPPLPLSSPPPAPAPHAVSCTSPPAPLGPALHPQNVLPGVRLTATASLCGGEDVPSGRGCRRGRRLPPLVHVLRGGGGGSPPVPPPPSMFLGGHATLCLLCGGGVALILWVGSGGL